MLMMSNEIKLFDFIYFMFYVLNYTNIILILIQYSVSRPIVAITFLSFYVYFFLT